MHILVTNDDGVTAPGLAALAQAMRALGRVTVVAPDHNWSASGHVKTMHKPLRVKKAALADGAEALATDGAPSDCVALAFLGVVPDKIDMVVSGINPFANMSHDVTYSGTVMAAMEGAIARVPAVAVSVDGAATAGYETAAWAAARVVSRVAERGLPPYTLLNVNVPRVAVSDVKGFRITRQGLRVYRDALVERADPRGVPYYWIGGEAPTGMPDEGTDFAALADGYVSVTPLRLDLTAYDLLEPLREWTL
ncbi:MAG: 5'/3'-nucleotidase SurE [Chloroflexi bacterium]|nr:5'/3'-nucleotidase SurE [Chloroflexota bacterium]